MVPQRLSGPPRGSTETHAKCKKRGRWWQGHQQKAVSRRPQAEALAELTWHQSRMARSADLGRRSARPGAAFTVGGHQTASVAWQRGDSASLQFCAEGKSKSRSHPSTSALALLRPHLHINEEQKSGQENLAAPLPSPSSLSVTSIFKLRHNTAFTNALISKK